MNRERLAVRIELVVSDDHPGLSGRLAYTPQAIGQGGVAVDKLLQPVAGRVISILVRFTAGVPGCSETVEGVVAVADGPGQGGEFV